MDLAGQRGSVSCFLGPQPPGSYLGEQQGLQPHDGGVLRSGFAPQMGGGNMSRPVMAILVPELESFLDIFKVSAPLRVTPVSLGVKHLISI